MDEYSLERIRKFFNKVEPWLQLIYPIVDELNKTRGRPPTDRRFQLRFVLYWKIFAPIGQQTIVQRYNRSPTLQKILQGPSKPYTRSCLRRFLTDLGKERYLKITIRIVKQLVKKKWLDVSKVIIDSFPIYSYLNYKKCLKMPLFDKKVAKEFFAHLNLNKIVALFPRQHSRSIPLEDKLKAWIHHKLWSIPSSAVNQQYIFGKASRKSILNLKKGWKSVGTYRDFLKCVKKLPNYHSIEKAILIEVQSVLKILQIPIKNLDIKTIDDLCKVFYDPHHFKDKESSLNYCAAKEQHFWGRGGLLFIKNSLNFPLYINVTSKYKQSETEICFHLKKFFKVYGSLFHGSRFLADSEFGTSKIINLINKVIATPPSIPPYGNSKSSLKSIVLRPRGRSLIETVLARLETNFHLEHPRCLGSAAISCHLSICLLADHFLPLFNLESGNHAHPHSFQLIHGKNF